MSDRVCRRTQAGQAMPSVVAVVSVIAVVAALVAFLARGSDEQSAASDARSSAATGGGETPSLAASASPGPAETTRAAPKQSETEEPKAKKRRKPRVEPDTGPPDVYVEVYNNTTISGLAADTAAQLQDGGWQVVGVDNWRGDIPSSTVYYPAGMQGEAERLARDLGFDRVRGAVSPMKFDRLTVILTPDAA